MKKKGLQICFLILTIAFFYSCKKDKVIVVEPVPIDNGSGVSVDLTSVPYLKLSDYHFFKGELKNQDPVDKVLPYEPATPLFTDYAHKKRFVWMPAGTKANYVSDGEILNFPVGSALIKSFYYDNVQPSGETRIIETRVLIKKSSGWIFATYVWNSEQTEAFLDLNGSYTEVTWIEGSETKHTDYRIPSETECKICHKLDDVPIPIGPKPQNLNFDYGYESGTTNQLQKWIEKGFLNDNLPSSIVSTVNFLDQTKSVDLRFRSYVDMNCAHCHSEGKHCSYRPMRLAFSETASPINLGLCVEPEEIINSSLAYIIKPSDKNRSMMYYRMASNNPGVRMPLVGRTMVHQEGLDLLEEWINWKTDCN